MLALSEPEAMLPAPDSAKRGFAGTWRELGSRTPNVRPDPKIFDPADARERRFPLDSLALGRRAREGVRVGRLEIPLALPRWGRGGINGSCIGFFG
jgi:hypothetical protein